MKQGDVVKVYFDPITKKKLEGEAALVEKLDIHPGPVTKPGLFVL